MYTSFIGFPLKNAQNYCEENHIKYHLIENFLSSDKSDFFVTNMRMKNEIVEITISKFKVSQV